MRRFEALKVRPLQDDQRNVILFVAISIAIFLLYDFAVLKPARDAQIRAREAAAEVAANATPERPVDEVAAPGAPAADPAIPAPASQPGALAAAAASKPAASRADALAQSPRVTIETPALSGSISLVGARFDDLQLRRYEETLEPDSPTVTLLHPAGWEAATYAAFGWAGEAGAIEGLPDPRTPWTLAEGRALTPQTPVTLRYETPAGLVFLRTIAIDNDYLFTIEDEVANRTGADVTVRSYGLVNRRGVPPEAKNSPILHLGPVGVIGEKLVMRKYANLQKKGEFTGASVGGWLGITDKYWLTALLPPADLALDAKMHVVPRADAPLIQTNYMSKPMVIPAGETIRASTRLFAGAKRNELLTRYEREQNVARLNLAFDWGNFWFLTKPIFALLELFKSWTGSFGVAILMLTVVVKLLFLPLANSSYKALARMKALQPKMTELRERFAADPQRQQQELVALYQREKINPLAGCLPIIPQIPVFYALYKTLFVTIEMRHAPFFGWVRDLSARDPLNIWNLFGLLPFDPWQIPVLNGVLGVGPLAILMGLSMAAMQTLNPPPPDKMQARIFAFMPIIFTLMLAPFAAGLVIYWTWNNILSFLQQYYIMRRHKVDTPIGLFISKYYKLAREKLSSRGAL